MTSRIVRRLATVGAMVLTASGVLAVTEVPAQAVVKCQIFKNIDYDAMFSTVFAEGDSYCEDGTDTPLFMTIQRQDPVTGAWVTVASGMGSATYHCVGTATRNYRTGYAAGDVRLTAPCG